MSEIQTFDTDIIQGAMARNPTVAAYIKALETAHSSECFKNATLTAERDLLQQQAAGLAEALEAMVTASQNSNRGLSGARDLADTALEAYRKAQGVIKP